MKQKSISVNAGLNMLKTICQVIFPLITFPYVSRVLHVENMGIYNFCQSITSYFALAAGLGISTYSVREGARYRENRQKMSSFASEVFSLNLISTLFSYIVLLFCIFLIPKLNAYKSVLMALSASILFTTIGCEWVFQVYEDFGYITVRSIAFQLISLILMFIFVRDRNDLLVYASITTISSSGANIINAVSRRKYCIIKFVVSKRILKHLRPVLLLFATSIATTIYTSSDVTMLGVLAGNKATGLYSVSTKIYGIVKQILAAIIIVSIPRLSAYLGQKKLKEFNQTANQILNALVVIVVPAMVGIFALSKNIVFIISGQEYIDANMSLKILTIALLFSIFSWFYTSCILIPYRCENKVLTATIIAAVVNIGLNFILIPRYQQNAAAITTVVAEFLSMTIGWWYGRRFFKARVHTNDILSVIIGCAGIWVVCALAEKYIRSLLISTIVAVGASMLIYVVVLMIMKNQSLGFILNMLKKKVKY